MTDTYKTAIGILLFLALSFVSFGALQFIENETVYLIKSRQIAEPDFIANDWSMGAEAERNHGILFSAAVAPIWALDLTPLQVAMTVRVIATLFLLFCAIIFLRSLQVSLLPGLLGLSVWVIGGQLAIAGEWVLGGAEQKPFAYGFILLAISAAIRARWLIMGFCLSVATWLHILIGAWAAIVLFPSALVAERFKSFWKIAASGVLALVLVSPAVYFALHESLSAVGSFAPIPPYSSVADLTMRFRVPHHLDPSYFLDLRGFAGHVLAGACLIASVLFAGFGGRTRRILMSTVVGLVLAVALGLTAYSLGALKLLTFYPFRVADGLLPLLAFLLTPYLFLKLPRWTSMKSPVERLSAAGSVLAAALLLFGRYDVMSAKYSRTASSWDDSPAETGILERDSLYSWIRNNTSPDSTFLAPPWWSDFRLVAERPVYVNVKTVPNNDTVWEWYRRLIVTNGERPFETNGFRIYAEMREGFVQISKETLDNLASKEQVQYYITPTPRTALPFPIAHQDGSLVIYDLR